MFRTIVLFAVLFVASVASTNVRQCSKDRPFPLSVNIEGCPEMPCDIVKGTTAVMDVHFVGTKDNIKSMAAQVRATTMGITVPYDLPEEIADVCTNLKHGASCPIDEGEDVIYGFNFPIESYYPEISVKVEISLVDESDESIACFVADIKVKKGNSGSKLL